jgi:hypothetical protein
MIGQTTQNLQMLQKQLAAALPAGRVMMATLPGTKPQRPAAG